MSYLKRVGPWALSFLFLATFVPSAQAQTDRIAQQAYEILSNNCFGCHGATKTSGLDLRTADSLRTGGQRGPAIVAHDAAASRLFQLVSHESQPTMPPGKKLSVEDIETLRLWIESGASLEGVGARAAAADNSALATIPDRAITPEERQFWVFQAPKPVKIPRVTQSGWDRNPIDGFLLEAMKSKNLKPSPKTDRRTLIQRAYLDLLGLPPKPEEVEAFVNDKSPDAWERLVDRLLASPHYGERWARHWLDLVRYADSGGFEFDTDRPDGWRYRDYVVNAFNNDKPYDRFIREQIAGDEYFPTTDEAMIATGFLRLGPEGGGGGEQGRQDSLDDVVGTTTLTFLGMTVSCARCHFHKFDPIPQQDYYRIQAVFAPTRQSSHPLVSEDIVAAHRAATERLDAILKPLRDAKSGIEAPYLKRIVEAEIAKLPEYLQLAWKTPADKRTEGQKLNFAQIQKTLEDDTLRNKVTEKDIVALMTDSDKALHQRVKDLIEDFGKQRPRPYDTARTIEEAGREPRPSYFLHRGSVDSRGPVMKPGVLSVIGDYEFPAPPPNAKSSWRRRGFAEWVASPSNPLTARVMVNRIWQHHFGEGIVRTPSNFGKLGDRPSHPELLDWLALEFVNRGWSVKAMHRLMMTSAAYQVSSDDLTLDLNIDPENRYFWRMPRERLEAEIIRDRILATAGTLNLTLGGPGIYPYIDPDLFESSSRRNWPGKADDDPATWRRSLYVYSKRSIRYPMFETFDQPNLINSVDRRNRSTVAPQALILMNNAFVITQAKYFAERLRNEAGADTKAQVDRAFRLALSRSPDKDEMQQSLDYIQSGPNGLAEFCQALFNLNEFVYRQ